MANNRQRNNRRRSGKSRRGQGAEINSVGRFDPKWRLGPRAVRCPMGIPQSINSTPSAAYTLVGQILHAGLDQNITFSSLATVDQQNYGSAGIRWNNMRVIGARVWGPGGGAGLSTNLCAVDVFGQLYNSSIVLNLSSANSITTGATFGPTKQPGVAWVWGDADQGISVPATTPNTLFRILAASSPGTYEFHVDVAWTA